MNPQEKEKKLLRQSHKLTKKNDENLATHLEKLRLLKSTFHERDLDIRNLTKELRELQPSMYIREFAPPKNPYNARKAQIQRHDIPTKYKTLPEYEIGLALYIKQLLTVEAAITNYKQAEEKQNKIILQEATKILEIRKQLQQNADNIAKVSTPIPAQAKISLVR